ncbi:MAG: DUF4876 domain-containing protein [Breznakibacter sp.]
MKKLSLYLTLVAALALTAISCEKDDDLKTYAVLVQLVYPDNHEAAAGVNVTLTNTGSNSAFTAETNESGIASFVVQAGIYEASTTERRSEGGIAYNFNGLKNFTVSNNWVPTDAVTVDLTLSKASQIIIKELYIGGCQKNDASGSFQLDKYVILYNNSDNDAPLDNLCLGMVLPYNGHATNNDYVGDQLFYEAEGWIPAGQGIWYFPNGIILEAGKQLVVALNNAVDNTVTYSNSINFANAEYYCTYDITAYTNTSNYPAPSEIIPTSHYLSAVNYGTGNAWALSNASPAFFIFATDGITPVEFANDADRTNLYNSSSTQIRKKVPVEWVVDGIEVFKQGSTNYKRLTANVDAGYIYHINQNGYTLYRNVDKDATEAIPENSGKLVYNYNGGTTDLVDGTTDSSGIDAEASIKNGARIIYKDTNSTTNDFHQRKKSSLRD